MRRKVVRLLEEEINPAIASHGGAVELVDLVDGTLYLRMGGGCQGCAAASITLRQGVERLIKEELPTIEEIVDVTDHGSGSNPYYSPGK